MFYLVLVMIVLVGGVITLIAVQNLGNPIALEVLIWQSPALPIGFILLGVFLLGAILLYLASVGSAVSDREQIKRLHKRVNELEQQAKQNQSQNQPPPPPNPIQSPQGPAAARSQMQSPSSMMQMPGMSGPLQK